MGDTEIASVMTRESVNEAGFKDGDPVTALIKAINVVFVKDGLYAGGSDLHAR
jgi:molybdopterin-binding protein